MSLLSLEKSVAQKFSFYLYVSEFLSNFCAKYASMCLPKLSEVYWMGNCQDHNLYVYYKMKVWKILDAFSSAGCRKFLKFDIFFFFFFKNCFLFFLENQ